MVLFPKTREKLTEPVKNASAIAMTAIVIALIALTVAVAGAKR